MTVLVTAASKHGATWEIAEAIGRTLAERGLDVEVVRAEDVDGLGRFRAVVLGSAVYGGHWLDPALRLVAEHGGDLAARETWLFSSGPLGDPPRPGPDDAVRIDDVLAATGARDHRVFAGRLDHDSLSFGERALVFAFRAEEGDFRDWDEIAAWAGEIADALGA
jgi:menaquinone-dependent protoporphyrinogen oxidase